MNEESSEDVVFEGALRPESLDEFVGQEKVREQLSVLLSAARLESRSPDHILLAGPPGLGKTTLAMIVAHDAQSPLRLTSGPGIKHTGDLAAILSALQPGDTLFIDEIHRLHRSVEEMLYLAMEDFRIDIVVGKGPGATTVPLDIAPFTLVGATTRSGMLPAPLRDRFGFTAHLEYYEPTEIARIIVRSATLLGIELDASAVTELSRRSRGTPRIANRLLRRVRDFLVVHAAEGTEAAVREALRLFDIDEHGLDRLDRAVLNSLIDAFGGGPVGVSTLASTVGEERDTIESVVEPYLVRVGLIARTQRGRTATPAAYELLGKARPSGL
ncbi:MAG: Holliday junction branch migration helicase RuvB [Actinomycetota bacterium]